MLKNVDLSREVAKAEFKRLKGDADLKLADLQRQVKVLGIPVIVVFEGWSASGKGTLINELTNHPLANSESMIDAAKAVRGYAEKGDEMALRIFEQQANAIGLMFSIAANFTDPDAYFVGGGIVEAEPHFRYWCMEIIRASTELRDEQRQIVRFAVVPDLDMAGARGSALAALQMLRIAAA